MVGGQCGGQNCIVGHMELAGDLQGGEAFVEVARAFLMMMNLDNNWYLYGIM